MCIGSWHCVSCCKFWMRPSHMTIHFYARHCNKSSLRCPNKKEDGGSCGSRNRSGSQAESQNSSFVFISRDALKGPSKILPKFQLIESAQMLLRLIWQVWFSMLKNERVTTLPWLEFCLRDFTQIKFNHTVSNQPWMKATPNHSIWIFALHSQENQQL